MIDGETKPVDVDAKAEHMQRDDAEGKTRRLLTTATRARLVSEEEESLPLGEVLVLDFDVAFHAVDDPSLDALCLVREMEDGVGEGVRIRPRSR